MEQFIAGLNWVDVLFVFLLIYFVVTNSGFIQTSVEILGFFLSLIFSYLLYPYFSPFYIKKLGVLPGYSNVMAFFTVWFIFEFVYFFTSYFVLKRVFKKIGNLKTDKILGVFMGAVQSLVVFTFFISLVFALPVRGQVKKSVLDSKTGVFFVSFSRSFESGLKEVFSQAAQETLNFLTVKPDSKSSVSLDFKAPLNSLIVDEDSESVLTALVNSERVRIGLNALSIKNDLRDVARDYAKQMFEFGFFSHTSLIDGTNAGDRVDKKNISYRVLGENLAFAPDSYIAHQGLMNSEGHRKNILSPDFRHIGIGIVDAGIYGKMFVQLFSD